MQLLRLFLLRKKTPARINSLIKQIFIECPLFSTFVKTIYVMNTMTGECRVLQKHAFRKSKSGQGFRKDLPAEIMSQLRSFPAEIMSQQSHRVGSGATV